VVEIGAPFLLLVGRSRNSGENDAGGLGRPLGPWNVYATTHVEEAAASATEQQRSVRVRFVMVEAKNMKNENAEAFHNWSFGCIPRSLRELYIHTIVPTTRSMVKRSLSFFL